MPPELAGLLGYLDDIGYGEVYLPAGTTAARAATPVDSPDPSDPPAAARRDPPRRPAASASESPPAAAGPAPQAEPQPPPEILTAEIPATLAGRTEQLIELARFTAGCTRCRLAEGRRQVVFGSGSPNADLMLVGEGPGAEEDRQGLPFVGPAGELLTRILGAIGLTRQEVYIANIVKCRPPGNRDPQPDEVAACRGYLERQIDLVQPRLLVTLGRVAAQTLLGNDLPLGRLRGQWWSLRGVPVRTTYHPAALLRNTSYKRPTWEDMQVVRDRLLELRQR